VRWLPKQETRGRVLTDAADGALWARVLDLSVGGAGLLLTRSLTPGTPLVLEVRDSHKLTHCLRGRVVHVAELQRGTYLTGSAFDPRLAPRDLEALLD
jgi:hypothetical protein